MPQRADQDQKIIDGTKKVSKGVSKTSKNLFGKYVVPDKPKFFWGEQLKKDFKPRETKKKEKKGFLKKII